MYKVLCKLNDSIYNVFKVLIICLLLAMSIMVFSQVVFRYVLKSPIAWSEELSTYCFSWLAFFGAAVVLKNDNHVNVSSFVDRINNKSLRKTVILFSQVLVLAFLGMVVYYSTNLVAMLLQNDQRLLNLESIRVGYVFMQVPISGLAMGLLMVEKIIGTLKTKADDIGQQTERMEGGVE
ncbi:TRAP transporter small permease [Petroclostridium sp. X23]|uniref:TRAP transporter small permease n=1 Tax=Petroclostridium sp. X23 TaxID=3045146 RepID=UPI0024ADDA7D|nr:TRAP transporter small permease [Petroclostridium sp. X23]WHH57833.1 TRAP transporter small permease [Petroclostridium sp. X23]